MTTQHAKSISNVEVTEHVLAKFNPSNQFYNPIRNKFYNLNDSTNRWDTVSENSVIGIIGGVYSEIFEESVKHGKRLPYVFEQPSRFQSDLRKIMDKLTRAELDTRLIPFSDHVVNLETGEAGPHRADQHITRTLPFPLTVGNSGLNPKYENDYKVLRGLFSYESNVIVLNASRDYVREISKLSGDFYHCFDKQEDKSAKGINPDLFGKHLCEIKASYEKIPYALLSKISDGLKLSYKHQYREQQSWKNTCTFLISFDEITAVSERESIVREATKLPFISEWTPKIPVKEITPELISSILTTDIGTATRHDTSESVDSDKPSILKYLQQNFVCDSDGFIIKNELTSDIDDYCEQHEIQRKRGDRKRALDTFCGCKESTNLISGNRIKVFRGLERKPYIPSAAPTLDLNLDGKHTHADKVLSTLNQYFCISKNKGTARRMLIAFLKHNHPETFSNLTDDEIMRYCLKPLQKFCKLGFDYPEETNRQGDRVLRGLKFNKNDKNWELYQRIKKTKSVVEEINHE